MGKIRNSHTDVVMEEIGSVTADAPMDEIGNGNTDFNSRLANAMKIDMNEYFQTIENADGSQLEVSKKTYNFVNPVGKRTSMAVYDVSIIESMEKISKALYGKTLLTYSICKEFSKIAESGKLQNYGFKNIAEFGKAVYGLETSTVNHYARIGASFINDDYTVKAGLPDLSVSHFIELSALVKDGDITPIIQLYAEDKLVDGMSTKKIRETLKSLNGTSLTDNSASDTPDTTSTRKESTTDNENTGDVVASESNMSEMEADFDEQVIVGKILNACGAIEQMFEMLKNHEVNVVGYEDNIDALKAIAKTLL